METPGAVEDRPVRELPIVGGHLALDFANTVDDPEGPARHDHIATYADLVRWSVRIGALTPARARALRRAATSRPRAAAAALRRAHSLRQVLIAMFTASATGAGASALSRHWAELRPFVTDAIDHAELSPDGPSYTLGWSDTDRLHAPLWPVARAAFALLTAAELRRVKRCAGCPWLYLDQSKNASRRWCSMSDCGTHAKIRRYVDRRAARRIAGEEV